ncbi:RfaL protein [Pasteurellaceae bacterium RH1A]|nr:RfaL protein [Pasteurellaceae bacterium RH1A]
MLTYLKQYNGAVYSGLVGLFFICILHFKISYSLIPILLALAGFYFVYQAIKARELRLSSEARWLVGAFVIYFLLFVASLFVHGGRGRELDLPSRALLVLPILLLLFRIQLKVSWVMMSLVIAANLAGLVAAAQSFLDIRPFPSHMQIQAGGIAMSLALFSLCLFFYFVQNKQRLGSILALTGFGSSLVASVLTTARGAWVVLPVMLVLILWFNRNVLSKKLIALILVLCSVGLAANYQVLEKRISAAQQDIKLYIENNNGQTSLGARFDMWESALLGIQEKPVFGWGLQGVREMRQKHVEQGLVDPIVSSFGHAHNQYLHDGSARGLLGLASLLSIFLVPLVCFARNLKQAPMGSASRVFGLLGITHILAVMGYSLSQAFLSHNSGSIFYFFAVIVFYALQKITQNQPLED